MLLSFALLPLNYMRGCELSLHWHGGEWMVDVPVKSRQRVVDETSSGINHGPVQFGNTCLFYFTVFLFIIYCQARK